MNNPADSRHSLLNLSCACCANAFYEGFHTSSGGENVARPDHAQTCDPLHAVVHFSQLHDIQDKRVVIRKSKKSVLQTCVYVLCETGYVPFARTNCEAGPGSWSLGSNNC